jgi:hypothetical protein
MDEQHARHKRKKEKIENEKNINVVLFFSSVDEGGWDFL